MEIHFAPQICTFLHIFIITHTFLPFFPLSPRLFPRGEKEELLPEVLHGVGPLDEVAIGLVEVKMECIPNLCGGACIHHHCSALFCFITRTTTADLCGVTCFIFISTITSKGVIVVVMRAAVVVTRVGVIRGEGRDHKVRIQTLFFWRCEVHPIITVQVLDRGYPDKGTHLLLTRGETGEAYSPKRNGMGDGEGRVGTTQQ